MKKLYYIVIAIGVIIFGKWIITSLPTYFVKVTTVLSESMEESSFSSTGEFAFKSTPEKTNLILEMININTEFLKNPPIEFNNDDFTIKNFYKLQRFFPEFKYYYIAKLKIRDTLLNELPILYEKTHNLSESQVDTYFNNNKVYLEQKWGIEDSYELYDIVLTIKEINGKKVSSYELTDSYFYMPDTAILGFNIKLILEDNSEIYLCLNCEVFGSNEYQSTPIVRFYGSTLGGRS